MSEELLVDPRISRAKFDEQIESYKRLEASYCRRGWFLIKAEFPQAVVIFSTSKVTPSPLLFGVLFDFSNYDLWPPSIRLVNPFTRVPYKYKELPSKLTRQIGCKETPTGAQVQTQHLMQAHGVEEIPFLCLPGVREYHDNPAHTGDSWLLHRKAGRGTLFSILENISQYGVDPISGYDIEIRLGLKAGMPPE